MEPPSAIAPDLDDAASWGYVTRRFRFLEHDFAIRSTQPGIGAHFDDVFGHAAIPGDPSTWYSIVDGLPDGRPHALYIDDERVIHADVAYVISSYLVWHVNQSTIRRSLSRYVLVHAAVAAWRGSGILLPAPQEAGKTTLIAGLVERGFGYLSDEAAAIDPESLLVVPFPKPLSIDRGSWGMFPRSEPRLDVRTAAYLADQWQVSPLALRQGSLSGPVRPRLLILPQYQRGARTMLEPIRRADALVATLRETFHLGSAGRRDFDVLGRLLAEVEGYRLIVGDLGEACDAVAKVAADRNG